ncbi:MAG: NUDIX domain-containing protein [Candidatus Diapherotrites archaeon]|nr:NUDIX domain-containing protein [Candidatus Diapherotrites archaeon]
MEEFIDEIDRTGKVIATHSKSLFKKRMFLHQGIVIIPMAKDNKFLLAKRAANKYPFPNTWCAGVGGKSSSGESPKETAVREMKEEIGKVFPIKEVASVIYNESDWKCFFHIFTTTQIVSPSELVLDPEEIQYVQAFSIEEILEKVKNNPEEFAPTFNRIIVEFAKALKK